MHKNFYRWGIVRLLLLSFFVLLSAPTHALGLAQGYLTTDNSLKPGMVVQLASDDSIPGGGESSVERATIEGSDRVVGLAAMAEDSFVVIANGQQQVYVQTTGEATALVSDINGSIVKGDNLTISPIRGVLMKANPNDPGIRFGTALEDYPTEFETYEIDGGSSGITEATVASVRISLDSNAFSNNESETQSPLAQLGRSIAGKDIGEIRVLIALVIFLIVLIAEGTIIYGAISSAITAMGRNPLAGKSIKKELVKILFVALIVLLVGLSATLAILKI